MDEVSTEPHHRPAMLGRAPLLWAAAAIVAGYTLAHIWPYTPPLLLAKCALPFAACALVFAFFAPKENFHQQLLSGIWGASFLFGASLLAWAWNEVRAPLPPQAWFGLPPREARLCLHVTQAFTATPNSDSVSGLARIADGPPILSELIRRDIYYRVRLAPGENAPVRGATVELDGLLAVIPQTDPGAISTGGDNSTAAFLTFLSNQDVWFELTRARVTKEIAPPSSLERWANTQSARLEAALRYGPSNLESTAGNIYVAMLLGKTGILDANQRDAFKHLGAMYLFAISGLHVGIVGGALWWCLKRVPRLPPVAAEIMVIALAWAYVEVTGSTLSARRAAIMFSFYIAAGWLRRPRSSLPAIVAAGVTTLLIYPASFSNAGFQLSYAVVMGLILYAPPLLAEAQKHLALWRDLPLDGIAPWRKCTLWIWDKVLAAMVISWTAFLCSAPLTAEYFGVFTPGMLMLNLVLAPACGMAICAGVAAMTFGLPGFAPFTWAQWCTNAIGLLPVVLLQWLARTAAGIPILHADLRLQPAWAGSAASFIIVSTMLATHTRARIPPAWYYLLPVLVLAGFAAFTAHPI